MELRSRKRFPDEEKPFTRVHDYFDNGGGIFVQCKLGDDDWEDDTHLIFAKNGPNRFVLEVEEGVRAELQLLCNVNFPVLSVPPGDSGHERAVDIAGQPVGKATIKTYYDLFYLTPKTGALRVLEGPGTWTIDSIFDYEKNILCLAVTGRHEEKLLWHKLLRLPLYIPRQSYIEPWGVISVNWEEMEREIPGVCEAQKPYVAGITGISRAPKPWRSKKKPSTPAEAIQASKDVDSEDEPLIKRGVPGPKKQAASYPGPSKKKSPTPAGAIRASKDVDSEDEPLIRRCFPRPKKQAASHPDPSVSGNDADDESFIRRLHNRKRQAASHSGPSVPGNDSNSDDRPLIKRHPSAQLSGTGKSPSDPPEETRPSQSPPPRRPEVESEPATTTGIVVRQIANPSPEPEPGEPPNNPAPTPESLFETRDYISSPTTSPSDSSYDSSERYNGTWKTVLRRSIRMETAFIDPTPLPRHPHEWLMSRRRPVLQVGENALGSSLVVAIPFNPYRDHAVVEMLRMEAGRELRE
ncbi:hypothetical protein MFIFM68171_10554 [Madurella fahalii]|uniref:Uncharacterized protein n=1 Tax=Madurella fahalii TaxID=1157608 RepID=A0ABQ0GRJ0_9PEZI